MSLDLPPTPAATLSPGRRLRELFSARGLFFLMEAHDGLSARIATNEGFPALWASGFSISTALGLRDCEEASWSQLLRVVENIVEASHVPVVVDGDTGHGPFNVARRFVRQTHRTGAAAVCFEDKVFPKMNSFVGDDHQLADVGEFCGKLKACRDSLHDDDFCLIARTEALIAGLGVDEALDRASAYADAGADALFIHSRAKTVDEIAKFAEAWGGRLPLVIAPTTYADTPTEVFRQLGISAVIWANQNMRAAFAAMRGVCRDIRSNEGLTGAEHRLAALSEVFEMFSYDQLTEDERRYVGPAAEPPW